MQTNTTRILPPFDFTEALRLAPVERMQVAVQQARQTTDQPLESFGVPSVPTRGATPEELKRLEDTLGVPLPTEYRTFLSEWRYLAVSDGRQIWGFDHDGISIGSPWISRKHRDGGLDLVFAHYWNYADGDQLLFDLNDPRRPVVACLHEYPAFEVYAPSFSLALWRMVQEES